MARCRAQKPGVYPAGDERALWRRRQIERMSGGRRGT